MLEARCVDNWVDNWIEIAELRGAGLVFARCLRELGIPRSSVDDALRRNALYTVRRGVYARPPGSTPEGLLQRHRNVVRALAAVAPEHVVSHLSAAAMHGLPVIGPWPIVHTFSPSMLTVEHPGPASRRIAPPQCLPLE